MKRWIFILFAINLATTALCESANTAVERTTENGNSTAIGAGGTVFWTWGFSFRHHFPNNFGVTTSLGGWFDNRRGHFGNEIGLMYTVGHHKIASASMPQSSIRVYLVGYLANIFRLGHNYGHIDGPGSRSDKIWDVGLGAGPGAEFFFNRYFAIHAELPWMTFFRIADKSFNFRDSYPNFGGGISYYF